MSWGAIEVDPRTGAVLDVKVFRYARERVAWIAEAPERRHMKNYKTAMAMMRLRAEGRPLLDEPWHRRA
jgi:hypothetical protein